MKGIWLGTEDALGIIRECKALRHAAGSWPGKATAACRNTTKRSDMTILDLTKATVACGGSAFLIYSFPVVGQVLIIGCLTLLWLAYARKTIAGFLRRP